jgi:hemolysin III
MEVFIMSDINNKALSISPASYKIPAAARYFRDPGSAITHMIAAVFTVIGAFPMLRHVCNTGDSVAVFSIIVFITSMFLLYLASTMYHSCLGGQHRIMTLKKLDHCMISVLIAGSYTPICLITLRGHGGTVLLALIWGLAALGIGLKLCWVTCPRGLSSTVYLIMGWLCVMVFPQLLSILPMRTFMLLLGGGICYSVGAIIYALKLNAFNIRHPYFGSHEIFHLFVMAGSVCHYLFMLQVS